MQANEADNITDVGKNAGYSNTTGNLNTMIGFDAGSGKSTGINNTCVGANAGENISTGSYSTMIGADTTITSATTTNANALGFGIESETGYTTVGISSSDIRAEHGVATWATVSDRRVKKDIEDSSAGLSFINDLRPRTFNYKNKGDLPEEFRGYEKDSTEPYKFATTNHGFIAQEVKETIDNHPEIVDGFKMWSVMESGQQEVAEAALIPMLTKAVQELSAKVEELESQPKCKCQGD